MTRGFASQPHGRFAFIEDARRQASRIIAVREERRPGGNRWRTSAEHKSGEPDLPSQHKPRYDSHDVKSSEWHLYNPYKELSAKLSIWDGEMIEAGDGFLIRLRSLR